MTEYVTIRDRSVPITAGTTLRFVNRAGCDVLQQRWTATSEQSGVTYIHEEWRDVPIEPE